MIPTGADFWRRVRVGLSGEWQSVSSIAEATGMTVNTAAFGLRWGLYKGLASFCYQRDGNRRLLMYRRRVIA